MSLEDNKTIVRRFADEFWNQRKLAVCDELLAPGFANIDPVMPQVQERNGLIAFAQSNWATFPDFHTRIDDMIAEGDRVVKRWTCTGTFEAPFMGVPAEPPQGGVHGHNDLPGCGRQDPAHDVEL